MDDVLLLDLAASLARRAAAAIEAVRRAGFVVDRKSDESPVTEADHVAEALIVEGLRAATPGIPVVAEEEVAGGLVTAACPAFWLVDPLDGTRDFAKGRSEYAVCIGLVREGRAVLGALALPATGEIFGGLLGAGAWKEDAASRRPIQARRPPPEGLTVLASRHYADDPRMGPFLAGRPVAERRSASSALKFCRVAEGVADLYPRFGPTMEWDSAAGQALVEAAGGAVTLLDGAPLRYGKPGWRNPDFICRGA
ncbi:3'(2'),5'-bisphosphate nucleotidase CysQ [Belnapia sp. T18]|uniref:3'(2'),5'-bisphosphate nucleotidase CysQ n=1 Tax=Belnapia arida TaxID=2804533 RepID=A0ABS1U2I3_9PROT|nr:3'(2'),5'-bisphosphate nucleotidase CysQ [Belnapia arida]MBL6077917.1 3'(2'),5'-bisphosphate nucleotidase CysQ [Belnapia arida]